MPVGDEQWINDQLAQLATRQPTAMPTGSPDDGGSRSWTGLLGGVLGGGQAPGYQLRGSEADASGNRALLNFGIQTLLASGPAPVRPNLLSALATGLQGAQSSTDLDQRRGQAAAVAQQGFADKQQEMQLARLKEALPLLKLQQEQRALTALKGGNTSTAAAPGSDPGFTGDKAKDLALIATRESHGDPTALNYVAREDPTAYERGATASGKYQIVNSTWADGMKLAGLDPSKYVTARSAPEAVQDQVASALYDKYGSKPWQKGTRDWVKGPDGKYQLATVAPSPPGTPYATAPTAAPAAPGAPPPPPGVQVGGAPPPPPGGAPGPAGPATRGAPGMAAALPQTGSPTTVLRETQERGPDGQVRTVVKPMPATPPTATAPSGQQVSANVGAILGGMDRASTATPASAMPMVGGPGAGPSAQPQPRPEAGWGAGQATGYGGGSPAPGTAPTPAPIVAPTPAPIVAPGAAPTAPAMAAPPPFTMRPLTPTEAAATSYDLDPAVRAEIEGRLQGATTVEEALAAKKDLTAALTARRKEADAARLEIEKTERAAHNAQWQEQQKQEAASGAAIKLETLKSDQALKNQITQKTIEPILAKGEAAQAMLKNAQNLELFARQQGDANALWSTDFGKRANNWIVGLGGNSEWAKEAAARQSWDTLVNGMFNDVHVPGMGAQSDRETGMLVSQWGSSSQTPLDRMTQLAIIRKNAEARIADVNDVHGLVENGKPASGIHDIRKNRQIFDRPPSATEPATGDAWNGIATYNASHPMGEPYVTWAPKKGGGGVMKWARNTGDPNNPIQLMPNVDVSR